MVIKVLLAELYISIFLITKILQQGILKMVCYSVLVYKFKKIRWMTHSKRQSLVINKDAMDIMRQSAYLVVNPITVYSYGFLFNCMTVGRWVRPQTQ